MRRIQYEKGVYNTMKKEELIKFALENEKLQKNLVELQREVSSVGLSKAAYAKKLQDLYSEAGCELTKEEAGCPDHPEDVLLIFIFFFDEYMQKAYYKCEEYDIVLYHKTSYTI